MKRVLSVGLLLALSWVMAWAHPQDNSSTSPAASSTVAAKASSPKTGSNSAADIAAAKASHKVWVNLDTRVYHRRGRWYGKTKNGKFMTEDEAKKAGYKAAKRE